MNIQAFNNSMTYEQKRAAINKNIVFFEDNIDSLTISKLNAADSDWFAKVNTNLSNIEQKCGLSNEVSTYGMKGLNYRNFVNQKFVTFKAAGIITAKRDINLVFDGHSFFNLTAPANTQIPYLATEKIRLNNKIIIPAGNINVAVAGSGVGADHHVNDHLSGTKRNVMVYWIGVNDISSDSVSGYNYAYLPLKAYCLQKLIDGWTKIILLTCTPWHFWGTSGDAQHLIFNNALRNELSLYKGIEIIDTFLTPELCDSDNTTYFMDTLHPALAGRIISADLIANKIEDLYTVI